MIVVVLTVLSRTGAMQRRHVDGLFKSMRASADLCVVVLCSSESRLPLTFQPARCRSVAVDDVGAGV